jgi:hypothetical protein
VTTSSLRLGPIVKVLTISTASALVRNKKGIKTPSWAYKLQVFFMVFEPD